MTHTPMMKLWLPLIELNVELDLLSLSLAGSSGLRGMSLHLGGKQIVLTTEVIVSRPAMLGDSIGEMVMTLKKSVYQWDRKVWNDAE